MQETLISANLSRWDPDLGFSGDAGNIVAANIIGLAPGWGYLFGTEIQATEITATGAHRRLLLQSDRRSDSRLGQHDLIELGSGVSIDLGSGTSVVRSIGNVVLNNLIGVTSDGSARGTLRTV
jgi:hypothetical protein